MNVKDMKAVLHEIMMKASAEAKRNNVSITLKGKLKSVHKKEMTEVNWSYKDKDEKFDFSVTVTPVPELEVL